MEYIGIDVHKRDGQVCTLCDGGEVVLEQRVAGKDVTGAVGGVAQ